MVTCKYYWLLIILNADVFLQSLKYFLDVPCRRQVLPHQTESCLNRHRDDSPSVQYVEMSGDHVHVSVSLWRVWFNVPEAACPQVVCVSAGPVIQTLEETVIVCSAFLLKQDGRVDTGQLYSCESHQQQTHQTAHLIGWAENTPM